MEEPAQKATLGQYIALWSYKAFCLLLRILDIRLIALFGRAIGYLVWVASRSRRQIVARNMRIIVDPMLRADKLGPMVRRNMVRTSMNLACSLKTGLMSEKEAQRAINIVGPDIFEHVGLTGTAICCVPHAGNWEILGRMRPRFNSVKHYGCMYRRLTNPLLEKLVYASRTAYGCEMFSKEDGLRAVLKLARSGGLLGVLSDQFTQEGIFLPYFGKVTGVTPLPALLYKRCKGKGTLFTVFTRNTGLGKWDAVLDRTLTLPEGCESLAAITMEVNKGIEACQKENLIDGFWMHHRWKCTGNFAPEQEAEVTEVAKANMRLPFRMIICMPDAFEEALCILPALRALKDSRFDAQLTVACPEEQQAFWAQQPQVTFTVTTDGKVSLFDQLEADELYKDGPFDIVFLFNDSKRIWKQLQKLMPIYVSAFADNAFARKKSNRKVIRTRCPNTCNGVQDRRMDYINMLQSPQGHCLRISAEQVKQYCAATPGNAEATGDYIAPFSSLGSADSWPQENWKELVSKLPNRATLLALESDRARAEEMATTLDIPCLCVKPEELSTTLGPNTRLFAVDGLLPQLAGLCGATCRIIMASRHRDRYVPMPGSTALSNHVPCHPLPPQRLRCRHPLHRGNQRERFAGLIHSTCPRRTAAMT